MKTQHTLDLACHAGRVTVAVGTRFASDGVVWEVVGAATGPMNYSPDTIGGTPTVRCKVVTGEPDYRFQPYLENGECDWCGDSIAAAIATLRALADEAGTVTGTTPDARDEAAEFLRIAADHCEDAIRALSDTP